VRRGEGEEIEVVVGEYRRRRRRRRLFTSL
jgi:hypothetical protein